MSVTLCQELIDKTSLRNLVFSRKLNVSLQKFLQLFLEDNAPFPESKFCASLSESVTVDTAWSADSKVLTDRFPTAAGVIAETNSLIASINGQAGAALACKKYKELHFEKDVTVTGVFKSETVKQSSIKVQELMKAGDVGIVISNFGESLGTSLSGYFIVRNNIQVVAIDGADNEVQVSIYYEILWVKPTLMKGLAESKMKSQIIERNNNIFEFYCKAIEEHR